MAYAELIPHDHRIEVGPLVDIKFKDAPKVPTYSLSRPLSILI